MSATSTSDEVSAIDWTKISLPGGATDWSVSHGVESWRSAAPILKDVGNTSNFVFGRDGKELVEPVGSLRLGVRSAALYGEVGNRYAKDFFSTSAGTTKLSPVDAMCSQPA